MFKTIDDGISVIAFADDNVIDCTRTSDQNENGGEQNARRREPFNC